MDYLLNDEESDNDLASKIFIFSNPEIFLLSCPPPCGHFLIQQSTADGLSYKVKNCREIFSYFATVSYFFLSDLRYRAFLLEQSREQGSRNSQPEVWEDN